jgi:hypothetical protein
MKAVIVIIFIVAILGLAKALMNRARKEEPINKPF